MELKVQIKLEELGLHVQDSEVLKEIDTVLFKELDHRILVFYLDSEEDLYQCKIDLETIKNK